MHHYLTAPRARGFPPNEGPSQRESRPRRDGPDPTPPLPSQKRDATSLVEIGPRFVLSPIRIFSASFGGSTLYHDASLVLPNEERAREKRQLGSKYEKRKEAQDMRREHLANNPMPTDELAGTFQDDDEI